jgi:hypothetical protein
VPVLLVLLVLLLLLLLPCNCIGRHCWWRLAPATHAWQTV